MIILDLIADMYWDLFDGVFKAISHTQAASLKICFVIALDQQYFREKILLGGY